MSKTLRVGIIGVGFGQHVLLPAFRSIDNVQVNAIAATTLEHAEKVAILHNIPRAYDTWQKMVEDPELDALAIAVPPVIQQDIVMPALLHNKHLFCEKPLGICNVITQEFALEADRRNLAHMVDFEFCAIPAWQAAHSFLQSYLGTPTLGIVNWQIETYAHRMKLDSWKTHTEQGGGVLFNFVSHALYNLEWLCGSITDLFMTCTPSAQNETGVHGIIKFENKLVVTLCVSNASPGGSGHRIELYGENGSFQLVNTSTDYITGFKFTPFLKDGRENQPYYETALAEQSPKSMNDGRTAAVAVLAERFVHWIRTGELQMPSFHQAHRVNFLLKACQLSQETQRWTSVRS